MARTLRFLAAQPVGKLAGVGPKLEERLAAMGLRSILDLLEHYPRRYHDRTRVSAIEELGDGEEATIVAEVRKVSARTTRGRRSLVEVTVSDGRSYLTLTFFNQPWRKQQLEVGAEVSLFGKVQRYRGARRMVSPVLDVLGRGGDRTARIVPVYPQSAKADVTTWQLRGLVEEALSRAGELADPLPAGLRQRLSLVDRSSAYRGVHMPASQAEQRAASRRLAFDEFLRMQVGLVARRRIIDAAQGGIAHVAQGALVDAFHASLPFTLTGAQRRALDDVAADMASPSPMHRLLQGDVGSGKTVVAMTALLMAVQGGYQAALMAPTEVLAEQHAIGLSSLVGDLQVRDEETLSGERPLRVELLTNRTGASARRRIETGLSRGGVDIVIGTHALLYEGVSFAALGLVVIDEQHRFGVEQRALLRGKGGEPDVLVMTATPIPRTAAMLVYGDLSLSELRELPPGRTPVATRLVGASPVERRRVYERVRAEVEQGRQAYVVCPLVEGSPSVEAKAAVAEHERLSEGELAGLRLGLLHGQMPSAAKEEVMAAFRSGAVDVLVATTVIEVGVDVPNATVMVVEDADRFGLSQLHQLRGRVGRGAAASICYLLADPSTSEAGDRMAAMVESSDGFVLAERDLEIRGAGAVFGERQSGVSDLKIGRIPRDAGLVSLARDVAAELLDEDPRLEHHVGLAQEVQDLLGADVDFLFKS